MAAQNDLAARLQRVWYAGARPPWWTRILAGMFAALSALRRGLYRLGLLRIHGISLPVIVVGNIAVGGSGKTPFVMALGEALRARGWRPGVVSRGYGRRLAGVVRVHGKSAADEVGDEPLLMAQRTGLPVAVASRRVEAARLLAQSGEVDVLIADDGLQHYALHRDLEIALIDGRRGLGNGRLLPAGPLRERAERLRRCDGVVGMLAAPATPAVDWVCEGSMGDTSRLHDGVAGTLAAFRGRTIHAVAGIADPARFFDGLRQAGIDIIEHAYSDHHVYEASELASLRDATVLTTEKDAVKLGGLAGADWWQVRWAVAVPDGLVELIHARLLTMGSRSRG